jgi:PAS domain S-box-containing protein
VTSRAGEPQGSADDASPGPGPEAEPGSGPDALVERLRREIRLRQRAEQALQRQSQYFRALIEHGQDIICTLDAEGALRYVSPAVESILGHRVADLLGRSLFDLVHPDDRFVVRNRLAEVRRTRDPEEVHFVEFRCRHADGPWRTFEATARNLLAHPAVRGIVMNSRDVTERQTIEQALDESQAQYRALLENAKDGIVLVQEERFVYVNRALCQILDRPEAGILGRRLDEVFGTDPEHGGRILEMHRGRLAGRSVPSEYEATYLAADGRTVELLLSVSRVRVQGRDGFLAFVKDVTQRNRLEQQLIRSERLAAVGTLASGLAHEFNNINVSLLGYAELALQQPGLESELRGWLERILAGAHRASAITRNLLAFTRVHQSAFGEGNLTAVVEETLDLVRIELEKAEVSLETRLREVPDIRMDAGQIGQVVLNLLLNAQHAMTGCPRRRLLVETGREGERVFARVGDSGCGIPPADLPKIFTPFFSTKGIHAEPERPEAPRSPQAGVRGTGLGLSVSHTIVENHEGEIEVRSEEGSGSTFTLWLPVRAPDAAAPADARAARPPEEPPSGTGGRALVIDDEYDTRELLSILLRREGLAVEATDDARDALRELAARPHEIVMLDLLMPRMGGVEFLRALETLPPDRLPAVIVVTGRSPGDLAPEEEEALKRYPMVRKPFELEAVRRAVRETLRNRSGTDRP